MAKVKHRALKPLEHPESLFGDVPKPPRFYIPHPESAALIGDTYGHVGMSCQGRGPEPEQLDGLYLIVTVRARKLVFGAAHEKWFDGHTAPFKELFDLPILSPHVVGLLQNLGGVDLLLADPRSGKVMGLLWVYISWNDLLMPPVWRKKLREEGLMSDIEEDELAG